MSRPWLGVYVLASVAANTSGGWLKGAPLNADPPPLPRGHSAWVFEFCSGLVDLVVCEVHHLGGGHRLTLAGQAWLTCSSVGP
jgi:hypothetical protein